MNHTHRWRQHANRDVYDKSVSKQVHPLWSSEAYVWETSAPDVIPHTEQWIHDLNKVVKLFSQALAQGRRSLETRVEALEKELSALKTRFRVEEEQDKALVAEIASIDDTSVGPDGADPLSLLPSGKELEELLRDYDR